MIISPQKQEYPKVCVNLHTDVRKKDTPQKSALREMMSSYLKENNVKVKDGTDVNSIMRDMMSIIMEGALDQEMDEELGYPKYD